MGSHNFNAMKVNVLRGQLVESLHHVMAVVVNEKGELIESYGDSQFLTFPRSAIKMLQALPLIESGAADHFHLTDKEICIACSSHHAEKKHTDVVQAWLSKISLNENALVCGAQKPVNEQAGQELIRSGLPATSIMNNCSGKHTGFLSTCLYLADSTQGYEKYNHPEQVRLRKVLTETMRIDHEKLAYGIDGCSIVTYATPLQNIAIGLSALLNPQETSARQIAAKRILKAVTSEPILLSGTGDFTSVVNEKTQGRSIVKIGAEGVFAGLIPAKGIAFALKAVDGAKRAAEFATTALLHKHGGLTEREYADLSAFTQPTISSWKGEVVGSISLSVS